MSSRMAGSLIAGSDIRVTVAEDARQLRTGHAPAVLAGLRDIVRGALQRRQSGGSVKLIRHLKLTRR